MLTKEALQHIETRAVAAEVHTIDKNKLMVVPTDCKLESLEKYLDAPLRIARNAVLLSSESFCTYVNRFKNDGTTVYLNASRGQFVAVIDHPADAITPAWERHTAKFAPVESAEWRAWCNIDGKKLTQTELAHFVELVLDTFDKPEPADMLKAATEFQSVETMSYGSAQNLDNGEVKFNFQRERTNASVTFPHRVRVALPIHENEDPTTFEARVRYKVDSNGVLSFTISFVTLPNVMKRDALLAIAKDIAEDIDGVHIYEGEASA